MIESALTPPAETVTALILEVFRLNGRLLAAGDRLVEGLGLSSARWQVLGAIALGGIPQPVAHLARSMGLNRQGVQRIVNELAGDGIVAFHDNPHHRRAKLVVMTGKGQAAYEAATKLQRPWVEALANGLAAEKVSDCLRLVEILRHRLEAEVDQES